MVALYRQMLARWWWVVILVFLGAVAVAAARWRDLGIEFQTRTLLDQKDRDFATFEEKHETGAWSESEFAVVCVSASDWISQEGVATLQELVRDLETLPRCAGTFSLLDIPLLRQRPDQPPNLFTLASGMKYLRDQAPTNWPAARTELLEHELAVGTLISRDGRNLNILVYLEPPSESDPDVQASWQTLVGELRVLATRWEPKLSGPVRLAGVPVVYSYIMDRVAHDLRVFGIAAAIIFTSGLLLIYRRAALCALPLLASVVPVAIILGIMAFTGARFTVITSNLPLLLFVIALPFTIYFTEAYLENRRRRPGESHLDSIVTAAVALWTPIFFSALTAISGFLAFATSGIIPVRMFGILMAAGTAAAVATVFLFFPATLRGWMAAADSRRTARRQAAGPGAAADAASRRDFQGESVVDSTGPADGAGPRRPGIADWLGRFAQARPRAITAASVAILVVALIGASRLTAENKFTGYFWPQSKTYRDLEFIDRQMGGTSTLEIYLTSPKAGYFKSAEGLAAVAAIEAFFRDVPETGSVRTLTSLTREARKSFRKEWFPQLDDSMVLALVESSAPELFRDIMSAGGKEASLQIRVQETLPTLNRQKILHALEAHLDSLADKELKDVSVEVTGIFKLYANMLETLIVSQRETLGFVIVAIFLMLLILFRSPVMALIVLLPQALPAVIVFGIMGWFHIPLDLVTVMIAAIALGVGVDSAIQYTVRFRKELAIDGSMSGALERSHATIGRAIWIATTVIVVGFGVLVFSDFFPSVWFGLFTGLAMLASQFSALVALPALFLITGYPKPPASLTESAPSGAPDR